ncbi:MAG: hypothetical protein O7G83_01505 [Proteobacteria bacterium]|nr:hypothetical protein [Pseudomonadota bacterium]
MNGERLGADDLESALSKDKDRKLTSIISGLVAALISALPLPLMAQSFNVDIGEPGSEPPPEYPAAGLPGLWNSVRADHITPFTTNPTPDDVVLLDLDGNLTAVGFHQFGGMDHVTTNDPTVTGEDAILLNDYLATHSDVLESCMYLNGLEDGMYEVLTYARMPNSPDTFQLVRFDFHKGTTLVGGAWPGQHEEGITYSRDIIEVSNGFLGFHVGIPPGGNTEIGAAFNGFQVRRLGDDVPAVSVWGAVFMTLLLLIVATVLFRRPVVA